MFKPFVLFLLAGLMYGQNFSLAQRVQAQASASQGLLPGSRATAYFPAAFPAEPENPSLLTIEGLASKREGNGFMTGTRIRLPPIKKVLLDVWYLGDRLTKQFGLGFRF
jgi:hypothetical protein